MKESFEEYEGGCEPLEFEVDFAGLTRTDMDATINWRVSDFENNKTFYTDSNGLGIVKREYKEVDDTIPDLRSQAPANWYPINTAIFIEDPNSFSGTQMLIMNDRSQGGSGFRPGKIELMFNRRGSTDDDLGLAEPLNESNLGMPIRTNNLYYLKFTTSREELYSTILRKTAYNANPV